jgi:protein PsiE
MQRSEEAVHVIPMAPIARGIRLLEYAGLVIVLVATIAAGVGLLVEMISEREVGIADLLLLFMYLEIVSMVETYWRMGKLPVRMPLYIAMVGIARHLMADSAFQSPLLMISGAAAIVMLALGVLIVRYGHTRFPYEQSIEPARPGAARDAQGDRAHARIDP